jgi:hypothetical protein
VYLTQDLKTPAECLGRSCSSRPDLLTKNANAGAAGIIGLWLLALRDYENFPLLDYLALSIGVAGYLVLETSARPRMAQASIRGAARCYCPYVVEPGDVAYPDWFYPLVEEKPFLTFGMPRDVFIPMTASPSSRWASVCFGRRWSAGFRMKGVAHPDPDAAFVRGMIPHHQGAIDMAVIVLKFGKDHHNHELARQIIAAQQRELAEMRAWLKQKNRPKR